MLDQYKDYCYSQLDTVLSESDVSQVDFISQWTAQVATEMGLDQATLAELYEYDDPYNANHNTRSMWKYAAAKGVFGTPTVFVNGVMLDNTPVSAQQWVDFLQQVYDAQYPGATQ